MQYLFLVNAFDFNAIFGNIVTKWYYYVILAFFLFALLLFFLIRKPLKRNNLSKTQKITYVSILTALCVLCNVLTFFPVSHLSLSFTATLCFVSGYILGAKCGFAIGFIGDLIGAILFPQGAYNPFIGIASGFLGFIPGLLFEKLRINKYVIVFISFILMFIVCTAGLNTFGLWLVYGKGKKTFWVYLIARLPAQSMVMLCNFILCLIVISVLPRILPKDKFNL